MSGQTVSLVMAGSGGAGVVTAGSLLLEAAARAGWYAYMTRSSGPQIRGGEAAVMVRLGTAPLASHDDCFHLLVGVDWQNVGRFAAEIPLGPDSLIIGDPGEGEVPEVFARSGAQQISLAMKALAKTIPDGRPNMVAFGAIAGLIGLTEDIVVGVLRDTLKRKGEAAIAASLAAFRAGVEAAADFPAVPRLPATQADTSDRWSITGNEATGMGALRGGVRFVAAYPITPATEVLEWLAPALPKVGGVLVQAEDELASINQIIGGSYGGVPSLTATSGPGLALMTESLGLAVAAEVPIVVVDVMRVGPSTGIATKSEQADLNIAVYGLHGDAPHLVLAPNSVADCLFTTQWAVHLAESLQTPAIVLTDQAMGQARAVMPRSAAIAFMGQREKPAALAEGVQYKRYANTASGVSPMAIPGMAGFMYTADGLEHNEVGTPSSQASDHQAQLDKRLRKLTGYNYGDHWADITGDEDADTAILTWGSSAGPAREALERLRAAGHRVKLVAVRLISPVQPEKFARALQGVERALVVEQSHSGQFHRYLRAQYDLPRQVRALHNPGPLAVSPGAIVEQILQWS
ncbi:2-oxoacid:acceptor oxidoreductase subunit alpha [Aromatoleum toluvorans]|uniref:2-oxoacid:acceptor oxidoreductase subunit alpha n=1 Tax=Aromatoleum toluvorans TaxID=92002 RepID=A0ABX1Q050_9RHOO|nr:2-oxoacid:acceptor oxidoreductase subunit alpha [Aromatoleum toluvorans]NMG44265.1 2-oxoacid:acceptor oxidoreductase subunit alpha [Aromatoleum toluvorans]